MALFPFNNAATNVYFAFYTYFTYYAIMYLSGSTAAAIGGAVASAGVVLAISTFNSLFAPLMRIFDGITDPVCGGIMGTVFSLVDKLISSLQTLLLQLFIVFLVPGLNALPAEGTEYMPGMKLSAIICFCLLPMAAWLVTLFCMTRYSLSGEKMREVQAVNAVRKAAVQGGMKMEEAMKTWQTIDQVPARFVQAVEKREEKETFLDRIYEKVFTRTEKTGGEPSSRPVELP